MFWIRIRMTMLRRALARVQFFKNETISCSGSSSDMESELEDILAEGLTDLNAMFNQRIAHKNDLILTVNDRKNIALEDHDHDGTNSSFLIDGEPSSSISNAFIESGGTQNLADNTDDDDEEDSKNEAAKVHKKPQSTKLMSSLQVSTDLSDLYVDMNVAKKAPKIAPSSNKIYSNLDKDAEIMKKCVITPDFEKQFVIPPYQESLRQGKKERKAERQKTKGKGWFGLPATELDDEKKNDLLALQMRRALDPKRFYKNNDLKGLPKYYQFGTVKEGPTEFYSARIPNKRRKKTIVDELLADAQFRKYNKRKYTEIQDARRCGGGPYQRIKRVKKQKK